MRNDVLVLFPGALGDFICFLPTLAGLMRRHPAGLTLVAKPEWQTLLQIPGGAMVSIDRREIADLFTQGTPLHGSTRTLLGGPSHAYSWTGATEPTFAERLAAIVSGPVGVYRFRAMAAREHAADYYTRCAGVVAAPFTPFLRIDTNWFNELSRRHDLGGQPLLVVHPGSGSASKNWTGFVELAARWQRRAGERSRVIILHGPAESPLGKLDDIPRALALSDVTLPQVGALLQGSDLYAGNDSGISHLAGAVGAKGVVVFGSTDPATWAPRGGRLSIVHAPEQCKVCGPTRLCTHRLSVARVERELERCEARHPRGYTSGS